MKFLKILFSTKNNTVSLNAGILFMRLFVGSFMLTHGLQKLANFSELSQVFPDPIGFGGPVALGLIVFAEFGCSILILLGLFTRLATIPLIFGMCVAAFGAHAGQPFSARELPIVYICIYISLLILGGGKCSLDYYISQFLNKPIKKNSTQMEGLL